MQDLYQGIPQVALAWGVSTALAFALSYRHFVHIGAQEIWRTGYIPGPSSGWAKVGDWFLKIYPVSFSGTLAADHPRFVLILAIAGFLWRGGARLGVYAVTVLSGVLVAASVGAYSHHDRLTLFEVPLLLLGLGTIAQGFVKFHQWLGWVCVAAGLLNFSDQLRHFPKGRFEREAFQQPRDFLQSFSDKLGVGDRLATGRSSRAQYIYYQKRSSRLPPPTDVLGLDYDAAKRTLLILKFPSNDTWVLYLAIDTNRPRIVVDENRAALEAAGALLVDSYVTRHGVAMKYRRHHSLGTGYASESAPR